MVIILPGVWLPRPGLERTANEQAQSMKEMMKRYLINIYTLPALAILLLSIGCGSTSGPSIEFVTAVAADGANVEQSDPSAARLGFVNSDGDAIAMENGGRIPLKEDKVAEVFLSPYPPDWNTDLHLFLLDNTEFEPIQDVEVDLEYDMVWMNHGIDTQPGTMVEEGHYMMPLSFLMYGDWTVDVRMDFLKEGDKDLQFIVKFIP